MTFTQWVELSAVVMEAAGIVAMLGGTLVTIVLALIRLKQKDSYDRFRRQLGRAILLGLEFLVAADIIRTVAEIPSLEKVTVLAIIVVIRTFLSFTLEVEISGQWPWQKKGAD